MPVERLLPTQEAHDLIDLTRDVADKVLAPIVDEHEKTETFPDGVFPALGRAGLLSLPYPEEFGGGAQPTRSTSRFSRRSRHAGPPWPSPPACTACRARARDPRHRRAEVEVGCPTCSAARPSAPTACPNRRPAPTPRRSRAGPRGGRRLPHQRQQGVDHQTVAVPTSTPCSPAPATTGSRHLVLPGPEGHRGTRLRQTEEKMGLRAVPTTAAHYDDAFVPAERLIGKTGQGLPIAFSALDSGRLVSPPSPSAWRRARSTMPSHTPRSARHSASASSTIRGSVSSGRHGRRGRLGPRHVHRCRPPAPTPDSPTPATRPSRSSSRRKNALFLFFAYACCCTA